MKSDLRCLLEDAGRYYGGVRKRVFPKADAKVAYGSDRYRQRAFRTLEGIHPRSMRLRVVEVIQETPSTRTFRFDRLDGPVPPFRAGQYVSIGFTIGQVRTTRAYSISSPPGVGHLDITVRLKADGFVSPFLFEHVAVGWEVTTGGPTGSFVHEPLIDRGGLVLIAGGSGITPFMSMIRHEALCGWQHPIDLVYGSRSAEDVIFGDELQALAASQGKLRYRRVISEPSPGYEGAVGLIDDAHIKALAGEVAGRSFLVCGPAMMYEHTLAELAKLRVPAHKIRRELYGPPADVTQTLGWPADLSNETQVRVTVAGSLSFDAPIAEPLLNSLERHGLPHRSSCRSGECADCRIRIVSGRTFEASSCVRQSDRALGYVHACVTYPLEDVLIEL
jgi:ferredoxin-NADP reductase